MAASSTKHIKTEAPLYMESKGEYKGEYKGEGKGKGELSISSIQLPYILEKQIMSYAGPETFPIFPILSKVHKKGYQEEVKKCKNPPRLRNDHIPLVENYNIERFICDNHPMAPPQELERSFKIAYCCLPRKVESVSDWQQFFNFTDHYPTDFKLIGKPTYKSGVSQTFLFQPLIVTPKVKNDNEVVKEKLMDAIINGLTSDNFNYFDIKTALSPDKIILPMNFETLELISESNDKYAIYDISPTTKEMTAQTADDLPTNERLEWKVASDLPDSKLEEYFNVDNPANHIFPQDIPPYIWSLFTYGRGKLVNKLKDYFKERSGETYEEIIKEEKKNEIENTVTTNDIIYALNKFIILAGIYRMNILFFVFNYVLLALKDLVRTWEKTHAEEMEEIDENDTDEIENHIRRKIEEAKRLQKVDEVKFYDALERLKLLGQNYGLSGQTEIIDYFFLPVEEEEEEKEQERKA